MTDVVTDDVVISAAPDPVVVTNDPADDVEVQTIVDDAEITSSLLYDFSLLRIEIEADFAEQAEANAEALAAAQADIEAEIEALSNEVNTALAGLIEAGTKMLFWQAAAPTGWTKVTTHNDKALRVVSGTGGGSGGSYAFSTVFARYQTDSHAIDGNELTYHAHSDYYQTTSVSYGGVTLTAGGNYPTYYDWVDISNEGGAYTTSGYAGASYGHVHGCEMRVQYLDIIICSKN